MSLSRFVVSAFAAVTGLTGCTLRTGPAHATTAVTSPPVQIETYPSAVYDRRTVYLYEDRWYYRDRGSWAYYREEPTPLYRSRHRVPGAPQATRGPYAPPNVAPAPAPAPRSAQRPPAMTSSVPIAPYHSLER